MARTNSGAIGIRSERCDGGAQTTRRHGCHVEYVEKDVPSFDAKQWRHVVLLDRHRGPKNERHDETSTRPVEAVVLDHDDVRDRRDLASRVRVNVELGHQNVENSSDRNPASA